VSFNVAMLKQMRAEGLDFDAAIRVLEAGEKRADNTNAERQARYRERRAISQAQWDAIRGRVFERDGFKCGYCGAAADLVCDHVTPLVAGGTNDLDNLITACRSCNASKGGKLLEEWQWA
jgi:5-methylcytosine-specific restriction endonuclease McrA